MNKERHNHAFPSAQTDAKNPMLVHQRLRPSRASLLYILLLFLTLHLDKPVLAQSIYSTPYTFTTLAGQAGSYGSSDGTNSTARFENPYGVAVDTNGNVYVADNDTIRKVTPAGVVTTLAGLAGNYGTNDGMGSVARFEGPYGVAVDANGNLYVADTFNDTIRKVALVGTDWVVTTLAGLPGNQGTNDGTGSAARFNQPYGVAVDSAGNLYVADTSNFTIRKLVPTGTNWLVTTLAGCPTCPAGQVDGTGSGAQFSYPAGVAVDGAGNVYVTDTGVLVSPAPDPRNGTIRQVTPTGVVTTIAGLALNPGSADGTNSTARFYFPWGIAVDSAGNVYVAEYESRTIRIINPLGTNWVVTTLAGAVPNHSFSPSSVDGTGNVARFDVPTGATVDIAGNLYVADTFNHTIRKGFPASSVPAPIIPPPTLNAGQFSFGISGLPNLAVNIESSTNLTNWQVISTNVLTNGTYSFTTTNQTPTAQFYRVQVR